MTSTQILKVRVVSASAKVRGGTTHDDRVDLKNDEVRDKTWIGVVPTWTVLGEPIASPENRVGKVRLLSLVALKQIDLKTANMETYRYRSIYRAISSQRMRPWRNLLERM